MGLDVSAFIYINFCILAVLNLNLIKNYLRYLFKYNFRTLDIYIYSSLLIFVISQMKIGIDVLSFFAIYALIKSSFSSHPENQFFTSLLYGLLIYALLTSVGVFFGGLEYLFLDSAVLHEVKTDLYPSLFQVFSMHASSLQFSYNSTAYVIISALGIIELLNFRKNIRLLFVIILLPALLFTGAKIAYIFLLLAAIIMVFRRKNRLWIYSLVSCASLGYLLLNHIIFANSGEIIEAEKYYRGLIVHTYGYDGYWSLFSWLKIQGFTYLNSLGFLGASISGFKDYVGGYEPHFLLLSLILFGGLVFSLVIYVRIIKNSYLNFILGIKENTFYPALAVSFLCETAVWDAHDSIIFWIVIFLCSWYKRFYKPSNLRV